MFDLVTVLGGSGFLGKLVVKELCKLNFTVQVVSRNAKKHNDLRVAGYAGQVVLVNYDLNKTENLEEIIKNSKIIINLTGIAFEAKNNKFEAIHRDLPSKIGEIAQKINARVIHISSLFDIKAIKESKYAKSKYDGEYALLKANNKAVILRPSVLIGVQDNFVNMFEKIASLLPFVPLVSGGKTTIQPIYAPDLANIIAKLSTTDAYDGQIYELGGQEVLTVKEFVKKILIVMQKCRIIVSLPFFVFRLMACLVGLVNKKILPLDFVVLSKYNTPKINNELAKKLDIKLTSVDKALDIILEHYSIHPDD